MLPPYIWAIAGLALTAAVHASPLPADNSTTAVDEAPTFYMPGEPVIVSTKVTTDSVPKVTTDAPNDSPTEPPIDEPIEHIPIGPPTNVTTSATAESSGPQVSGFYSNTTTLNKTTANLPEATKICKHDARDPKTWKDSGAARYVEDFLDDNKFSKWLLNMDIKSNNFSSALECSGTSGQACPIPEGADCPHYNPPEFFYVRTMASRVNEAFRYANAKLLSNTLAFSLNISDIIDDFRLPEPDPNELTALLRNLGTASSMSDKIIKQSPGFGRFADFMGFLGGAIQLAGINIPAPELRDYEEFKKEMETYLGRVFTATEGLLHETIVAVFGEGANDKENDQEKVRDIMKVMSNRGQKVDYKAERPVVELLKGGAMMVPVQQSDIGKSIDDAVKVFQHGVIGRYLTSMHLYVEYFEKYHKTKDEPECGSKGAYEIDGKCYILRRIEEGARRDGSENWRPRLEDEYLDAMEKYGIDIEKFMKNIIECNNEEGDDEAQFDDEYPKCFFGMPFAVYADNYEMWDSPNAVDSDECYAQFRNWKDLPSWLTGYGGGNVCDRRATPEVKYCKITAPYAGNPWTEWALDRRRVHYWTEGIDPIGFKAYFYDGRQCVGISNRQCFEVKPGDWVVDGSATKGGPGRATFHNCMVQRFRDWADDHGCELDTQYDTLI